MCSKLNIFILLFVFIPATVFLNAFAEDKDDEKISFGSEQEILEELRRMPKSTLIGGYLGTVTPLEDFTSVMLRTGGGFGLYYLKHFDPYPIALGPGFDLWSFGEDPGLPVQQIVALKAYLRFQPNYGFVLPYFEFASSLDFISSEIINIKVRVGFEAGAGLIVPIVHFYALPFSDIADIVSSKGVHSALCVNFGLRYKRGGDIGFPGYYDSDGKILKPALNYLNFHLGLMLIAP